MDVSPEYTTILRPIFDRFNENIMVMASGHLHKNAFIFSYNRLE